MSKKDETLRETIRKGFTKYAKPRRRSAKEIPMSGKLEETRNNLAYRGRNIDDAVDKMQ